MFGEPGTDREEEAARFIASGGFTKPVVAMIPGEFWETSPTPASVSHTGALIERGRGAPSGKKKLLREAGVLVAERFSQVVPLVKQALGQPRETTDKHHLERAGRSPLKLRAVKKMA